MRIDIYSDTICPWCFIGKRRLERALAERPQPDLTVHWRAFQLPQERIAVGKANLTAAGDALGPDHVQVGENRCGGVYALPVAAAFASTLTFYRMAADNEITAAAVSGVSYRSILLPVAGLMSLGSFEEVREDLGTLRAAATWDISPAAPWLRLSRKPS